MNFLVITSTKDVASMNIRDKMLHSKSYSFEESNFKWNDNPLYELKEHLTEKKNIDYFKDIKIYLGLTNERLLFLNEFKLDYDTLNPNFFIFASRHTSKTARPALLTHTTGNWNHNTEFGGDAYDLSCSSAFFIKAAFFSLKKSVKNQALKNFVVDVEVTHHGPTKLKTPLIYMELGSNKKEWANQKAGIAVADAIIDSIFQYLRIKEEGNNKVGIGFGGTHYAPNFSRLITKKNIAISFICPKYYIKNLTQNMVEKMITNTTESIDFFVIDWKGTNSGDKKHLIPILEKFNIPIKKTKDF